MSKLKIVNTVKRAFNLLKKDPTLIVLFILPAVFSILSQRILDYLFSLFFSTIMWGTLEPPPMLYILLLIISLIFRWFFGVWASAGAVLKVMELEKGSKLGLKEALSKGLKKAPKLLVPAIISLAVFFLTIASLAVALTNYPLLLLGTGPSVIVLRVAIGCLFIIGLYFVVRLRLYAPACVLENNFGLKTSWELVKGSWWRLFAIVLILFAMSGLISLAWVIGLFLSDVIVGPFTVTAMTLVYFHLKEAESSREERKESL